MAENSKPLQFVIEFVGFLGFALGAARAAATGALQSLQADSLRILQTTPLTAAQIATAYVKHVETGIDLDNQRALNGIIPSHMDLLTEITGNPPGPEALVDQWRRKLITDEQLVRGIHQGYMKDEWVQFYRNLQYVPISTAEAVQAAVQSHMPYDDALIVANNNGISGPDFDILYETAGNPPGPETTLTMWNRGIFTEGEAVQALRESRLKDKYIEPFMRLARRRIPARTISTLVGHGALTTARAAAMLKELGYSDDDSTALLDSATKVKAAPHHQLAAGTIKELYVDRLIPRDVAIADLALAGYDEPTATALLQLADAQQVHKMQSAAITKVRTIYVAHHMDETQARADLAMLGVAHDQIEPTIQLWTLEREANIRTLTEAQLRAAAKKGVITVDEYVARLVHEGYRQDDAVILAQTYDLTAPRT